VLDIDCMEAIGIIECAARYRYEAPRQGVLAGDNRATVRLFPDRGFEVALDGLAGFERIWLIYEFHLNEGWQPMVQPPRAGMQKVGMFATRSPHRPNRIGMSCVRLLGIDGLVLTVADHDLLDRTPLWDIKPYLPYADAFPAAAGGWIDERSAVRHETRFSPAAVAKAEWIAEHAGLDCVNFANVQLSEDPADGERKRIEAGACPGSFVIAYRTWRLHYSVQAEPPAVDVADITSGYSAEELIEGAPDPHGDKSVHRDFVRREENQGLIEKWGLKYEAEI
jgi:tRNA-Thr(GGU) m(6)t(6)A37 methyltransferase TsaA